jgi:hypothetical protein
MTDTPAKTLPVSGLYTQQGKIILDEHELLAFVNWAKDISNPRRAALIRYVCEGLVRDAEEKQKETAKTAAPPIAPTKEHLIKLLLSDDTPSVNLDCKIAEYFGYTILDDGVTDVQIRAPRHGKLPMPLPKFTEDSQYAIRWATAHVDLGGMDIVAANYMQDFMARKVPSSPSVLARCYSAALMRLFS